MLGSLWISVASLVYFDTEQLPPFVIEKLPVRFEELWMSSLRVHVASALISFPACLALMTRSLQKRRFAHRVIGRVTGALVLFALVPSGAVLALEAKGGFWVSIGFLFSGALVFFAMVAGIFAARAKDLLTHRRAMCHVVAQMSVAVTSRAMLIVLDALGTDPEAAYVWALWVPVILSAVVAELWSGAGRYAYLTSILSPTRSFS